MRHALLGALVLFLVQGCGEEGDDGVGEYGIDFPHEVTISAERALVAATGEILERPNFKESDLVTYKSTGVKITSGCPVKNTECMPLHVCRPSPQSLPLTFARFEDVCRDQPQDDETSTILDAVENMGFTVRLNKSQGVARFWVKSIEGSGASARLTLVYDIE